MGIKNNDEIKRTNRKFALLFLLLLFLLGVGGFFMVRPLLSELTQLREELAILNAQIKANQSRKIQLWEAVISVDSMAQIKNQFHENQLENQDNPAKKNALDQQIAEIDKKIEKRVEEMDDIAYQAKEYKDLYQHFVTKVKDYLSGVATIAELNLGLLERKLLIDLLQSEKLGLLTENKDLKQDYARSEKERQEIFQKWIVAFNKQCPVCPEPVCPPVKCEDAAFVEYYQNRYEKLNQLYFALERENQLLNREKQLAFTIIRNHLHDVEKWKMENAHIINDDPFFGKKYEKHLGEQNKKFTTTSKITEEAIRQMKEEREAEKNKPLSARS